MLSNVYRNEARFLQHLQTQRDNIGQYKGEVVASAQDVSSITEDANIFEWLIETCNAAENFKSTAMGIKKLFFSVNTEPPVGQFVNAPDLTPPAAIIAGAIKRSRDRDQRFLRAVDITEAARIALDLIGETPDTVQPDAVKPGIEAHAAAGNYEFAVLISNRQQSDLSEVSVQRSNSAKWQKVKSGTGKSLNVTLDPTTDGKPEQVLVRVQLFKNNQPYGVPSDPVYVTVNP